MQDTNLFWYLKNVDLFQGLSARELREVAKVVNEKVCQKKEILYTPHSKADEIYILKKGEITLYASRDGKRFILDVFGPGSIFGCLSPSTSEPNHFAEVTQESYICTISLEKFSKLLESKPHLLTNLLRILAQQIQEYQKKLQESFLTAEEKVILCLKQHGKSRFSFVSQWFTGHQKLTHSKIAEQTGLARETVSRIMSKLKKENKV